MIARYYRELLNHFTRAVKNRDGAADIVQEAYARVLTLQRAGQAIPEPRALLYRVARNVLIDGLRRDAVRGAGPRTADTVDRQTYGIAGRDHGRDGGGRDADLAAIRAPAADEPETALASSQAVDAMLRTIAALPQRCREAFILHRFDGLTHAEVAVRMGISPKTVEQHIKLAMMACRRCREQLESDVTDIDGSAE